MRHSSYDYVDSGVPFINTGEHEPNSFGTVSWHHIHLLDYITLLVIKYILLNYQMD